MAKRTPPHLRSIELYNNFLRNVPARRNSLSFSIQLRLCMAKRTPPHPPPPHPASIREKSTIIFPGMFPPDGNSAHSYSPQKSIINTLSEIASARENSLGPKLRNYNIFSEFIPGRQKFVCFISRPEILLSEPSQKSSPRERTSLHVGRSRMVCSDWATYDPRTSQMGGYAFTSPESQRCFSAPIYFSCKPHA